MKGLYIYADGGPGVRVRSRAARFAHARFAARAQYKNRCSDHSVSSVRSAPLD